MPEWSDLLFGMTVAVIAYTGIEAAANLAPGGARAATGAAHARSAPARRRCCSCSSGMSVVALMALPVRAGRPGGGRHRTTGYGTELGGKWIEAPVLGVVEAISSGGFAGELLS